MAKSQELSTTEPKPTKVSSIPVLTKGKTSPSPLHGFFQSQYLPAIRVDDTIVHQKKPERVYDASDMYRDEVEAAKNSLNDGTANVIEPTELGESLKQLNLDDIQPGTRMSGIDMRANLHPIELSAILSVDTLVSMRFLPVDSLILTRQKKRLSVSLHGKGRNDIVAVVAGKREQEANGANSFMGRVANVFNGGGQKKE